MHTTIPSGKNSDGDLTLIQICQRFSTSEAAREYFEKLRWPEGPVCAHCGNADQSRIYKMAENAKKKIRPGLYKCGECRDSFTVTVGTVMEDSHIPINKWLIAFYMMCASKTQVSALQLQRQLEIGSYRSAWFMCHRIRFALHDMEPSDLLRGTVEADETYIGGVARGKGRAKITPGRIAGFPLPNGEGLLAAVRAELEGAAKVEAIALEGAQDVLDSQIARQRLSDIKQAPERLISGKILDFRLSELEKN